MQNRRAFTLVELLVVIAIISILAAMLLPALEGARTQAQKIACANGLRQMGLGVIAYTGDWNGRYPRRSCNDKGDNWQEAWALTDGYGVDDRPVFRPYFPVDLLNCPLAPGALDMDGLASSYRIFSNYDMWFGGRMRLNNADTGMYRVGEHPAWGGETFDVLLSDGERKCTNWNTTSMSAHPDADQLEPLGDSIQNKQLLWYWINWSCVRGPVDRWFLHDDGSVSGMNRLVLDDPRTTAVPYHPDYSTSPTGYLPPTGE